ncbi:tetratricopeptide repeat protein [Sandaracinus amylolyticus]|uniref:PEGA domain-containing protein n=1 Tax=Sandaracinus amylolyticus TaxID=927083 RepID=A0A0F6W024_9BACT|nr:tetratricopeptide repeat protein [Sandaracinus amylolyticus]AKF03808.1 hypothetical protein DB32_000957 [Sandaracinus amylolyticus]
MIARGTWIALVAALSIALVPALGIAQEDARTLFQRGQTAYSQGDYDAAIEQWTRAYELDPRPLLQFNLSQAYERLGRLEDAIHALELYLERADPNDEHQSDARARVSALRERVGRTSVRVTGGPEGATILVDGEDRGRTPRPDPIQVSPGSHRIAVRAQGYAEFTSSVVVPAGQSVDVAVDMQPSSGGAQVAQGGDELPVVPIILFSAGGAALIAGAVMGGVALSDAENAPGRDSPEADAARGLALGADITMGAGVALAAAGLIVLLVADSGGGEDREPERISLAPWGGASGGGVAVAGSF